ncbi:MAG: endonuclease III [Deltaproteobacteria bacterium]|nr:endonuclease III [Deltaproteobacteria bacterium]
MDLKQKASWIEKKLDRMLPDASCALNYGNPWELLVATILSAQCTDERVNQVTPDLFKKYPDVRDMARAVPDELEEAVRPTGFFRNKAKSLKGCAEALVERFGGEVPPSQEELVKLPGIGRKTANLILGETYGIPGIVVDTHVSRVAQRLGLTGNKDAVKIEFDLMELFPKESWNRLSHRMIWHGRLTCTARKPKCPECELKTHCDYYQESRNKT